MEEKKEYLTKEKYSELTKELEYLKTEKRKEISEHLEYSKSLGDLSENAEYHEAREEQATVEDRIMKLEMVLKTAIIAETKHTEVVGIGSTVVIKKESENKTNKYKIVGSEESNVVAGKLSIISPLGEAMLGKKKGDKFSFKTPTGIMNYKIIDIE